MPELTPVPDTYKVVGGGLTPVVAGNPNNADAWAAARGIAFATTNSQAGLRRFRAKLAQATVLPVHINCYGDSITEGVGTEGNVPITDNVLADTFGWPGQLRVMFAAKYGTNPGGTITPKFTGTDSRVTSSTGTTDTTCIPTTYGTRLLTTTNFTVTTPICKTIDVQHYAGGSLDGTLRGGYSYNVDAAGALTGLATGVNATPGYFIKNVGVLSNATHSIALVGLDAALPQVIAGVRYHDGKGVTVSRFAKSGFTILDLDERGTLSAGAISGSSINATTAARVLGFYAGAFGADLNIIAVGENDALKQTTPTAANEYTTLATYEASLRAKVASQTASGGCTLLVSWSPPPFAGGASAAVPTGGASRLAYHAVMAKIANDTDHVAHFDMSGVWGVDGDWCRQARFDDGFFSAVATVHPSILGYGNIATALFNVLTQNWVST